jgi:diacylglycerol kinase family enzyme
MRVGVIINKKVASRNTAALAKTLRAQFLAQQIQADLIFCDSNDLITQTLDLLKSRVDGIIAGGGDGTLSAVAEICARESVPMGVLPLGTHNHFVKDACLPTDLEESIRCIAARHTRRVDMGCVNDCCFINNSSVGAYPRAVEERRNLQNRFGLRKHVAGVIAVLRVFAKEPKVKAVIEIDGKILHRRGPFVFVGNNDYSMRLLAAPGRDSMTGGKLCVFTAQQNGLTTLAKFLWLAALGRLGEMHGFEKHIGERVTVRLNQEIVHVARDGEVSRMSPPLEYRIVPRALEIFAPSP